MSYFTETPLPATALISLIRRTRALLQHGINGQPLSEENRALTQATISTLCRRLDEMHLAPAEPVTDESLFDLAVDCDRYVTDGDGLPRELGEADIGLTFAFRQMIVAQGRRLPGGGIAAKMLDTSTQARAAAARASTVRRPILRPREQPASAPLPAPAPAAPPPAPLAVVPAPLPALPAPALPSEDAFRFGARPSEPLDLGGFTADPQKPASPAQGTAGEGSAT